MSEELEVNVTAEKVKPKKKFVFAKDRRQAILAIVVMLIFFANTAYMIFKYFFENKIS